jgi:hypothetical protein
MDSDRKYKQRGYMDSDRDRPQGGPRSEDRPRQPGPRLPLDVTGPRLPRLVEAVVASRCFNCAATLPPGTDFKGACPKCGAALHCCKQCTHFDPSKRFQCLKPVAARIAVKDQANGCEMFAPRVTVARDAPAAAAPVQGGIAASSVKGASEARAAFDSLFKK